jgi:hypothetical protein
MTTKRRNKQFLRRRARNLLKHTHEAYKGFSKKLYVLRYGSGVSADDFGKPHKDVE